MTQIDFVQLQDLFKENSNVELIYYWYEILSKYDPKQNESTDHFIQIIKAMKFIMDYKHAKAEELKEMVENEAAELAEKQVVWERERENIMHELSFLRGRITPNPEIASLNETFRLQINNLHEENVYLNERNKERDREVANQNNKIEMLNSQIQQLEKERTSLIQQVGHYTSSCELFESLVMYNLQQTVLDDTIRELNRRFEDKAVEMLTSNEAESIKLRKRTEQAVQLSKQLHEVVQQNDELRAEIEQLSEALISATKFIEDTTGSYEDMRKQLRESDKIIERLTNDNELLTEMNRVSLSIAIVAIRTVEKNYFQDLLRNKNEQIKALEQKFEALQTELESLQSEYLQASNIEREKEIKELRLELVKATQIARDLFDTSRKDGNQSSVKMQQKINELNELVNVLKAEITQYEMNNSELIESIEVKDAENLKVNAELKKLRTAVYGNSEPEIAHLEKQLSFREKQIEKLTTRCSMLQIELSNKHFHTEIAQKSSENANFSLNCGSERTVIEEDAKIEGNEKELKKCARDQKKKCPDQMSKDQRNFCDYAKKDEESSKILNMREDKKEECERSRDGLDNCLQSWEASAMIISSLNRELMLLIQELHEKDEQLKAMDKCSQKAVNSIDELKIRYFKLQKEVAEYENPKQSKVIEQIVEKMHACEIEIEEYKKMAEYMKLSGNVIEQKMEEMNRQVVAERLRNLRLVHKLQIIERNRKKESLEFKRLQKNHEEQRLLHAKQLKTANYESDLAMIEIASLQILLLHSVPKQTYDELLSQHKRLLIFGDASAKTDSLINNETVYEDESEELKVENSHLKAMIDVLTSQNEYWQKEVEKFREQMDEMRDFLEDVESESQVKSLLVALEQRFLKALSDRTEFDQNRAYENQQYLQLQNEFNRKRRSWAHQRKKLVQVVRALQSILQCQSLLQRMRSNSIDSITVQQFLDYKEKIEQIKRNHAESEQYKEKVSLSSCKTFIKKEKEELDLQLRHVEALRNSYESVHENDYNLIRLQKNLQANMLNVINVTTQLEHAELQIKKKDAQIQQLSEMVETLQNEVNDLSIANFNVSGFDDELNEQIWKLADPTLLISKKVEEKFELKKPITEDLSKDEIELTNEKTKQTTSDEVAKDYIDNDFDVNYQKDIVELVSSDAATENGKITYSSEYIKKLNYIRETAKLCVANYKEQLKYKDEVIKKYKGLLQSAAEKVNDRQMIHIWKEIENPTLRNDVEELSKVSQKFLTQSVQQLQKEQADACSQTDFSWMQDQDIFKISEDERKSMLHKKELDASKKNEGVQVKFCCSCPIIYSAKIPQRITNEVQNDTLMETLRREQLTLTEMRMEMKEMKQRITALTARNNELEQACESIRAEALAEIKESYTTNNYSKSGDDMLRFEETLSVLRVESENHKKVIRQQNEVIDRLQKTQPIRNSEKEVARWREKKAQEGKLNSLRQRVKEMQVREEEMKEKVRKNEIQVEELLKAESVRSNEIQRLTAIMKKLKNDKEMSDLQQKICNDRLKSVQEMNNYLNKRIAQLKTTFPLPYPSVTLEKRMDNLEAPIQIDAYAVKIKGDICEEELDELRNKAKECDELLKRLTVKEMEIEEYREEIQILQNKVNQRKYDCGAVAVLRDKLMAKEKFIQQQQQRIDELEREKWQNSL
ncbi:unnamed protein product [Thelazia callipaeda]|uniref:Centrosomal protein of 290kDa coiled-coil region domain-containing protein n=1 Tax=Thelazia callipaeda TaxID=103827 RepID=A0A158RBH8_THECL|nr:unnamed protein product [Thelazia callipaeda]